MESGRTLKNSAKRVLRGVAKRLGRGDTRYAELAKRDIFIHPDSDIGRYTTVGEGTNINGPALIRSRANAPVSIGKYCAIAHNLRIRPRDHYTGFANLQDKFQNRHRFPNLDAIKGAVTIGNNVWIGDNVLILSGVTIGDGAVVGAGSIVTKPIPAYAIAVGSPAKVIKWRFSESVIQQLKDVHWWEWSEEKIARNRRFFETDLRKVGAIDLKSLIVN